MNYNDENVEKKFGHAKNSHSTTRFGQVIILIVIAIIVAGFVIPKVC